MLHYQQVNHTILRLIETGLQRVGLQVSRRAPALSLLTPLLLRNVGRRWPTGDESLR